MVKLLPSKQVSRVRSSATAPLWAATRILIGAGLLVARSEQGAGRSAQGEGLRPSVRLRRGNAQSQARSVHFALCPALALGRLPTHLSGGSGAKPAFPTIAGLRRCGSYPNLLTSRCTVSRLRPAIARNESDTSCTRSLSA